MDGNCSKHGTYVFSATVPTPTSSTTPIFPAFGFHVAISYPTNPEVLEGSDLSWAPVPDWSSSIFPTPRPTRPPSSRERLAYAALAIPLRRRRVSCTIASGLISFSLDCMSHRRAISFTQIYIIYTYTQALQIHIK